MFKFLSRCNCFIYFVIRGPRKKDFFSPSCKLKLNLTVTRFTGSHLLLIGTSGFRLRQAYAVTSRSLHHLAI